MTREDEEREIREARTTADVMARTERIAAEVQRAVAPIVEREAMGAVVIVVDPHAPRDINALVGGGNLTMESMRDVVATWLRMTRKATDKDKVRLS